VTTKRIAMNDATYMGILNDLSALVGDEQSPEAHEVRARRRALYDAWQADADVPNSGMVPLEQRAALLRALNNAANYAPKDMAKELADKVHQLLDERDKYGQDAYFDGQRADAAESDLVHWSHRIDEALKAIADAKREASGDAHQGVFEALDRAESALGKDGAR
jgi:hypothetical protein